MSIMTSGESTGKKPKLGPEALITIGGLVTSVAAAFVHSWIGRATGIDVSSWMFWFVIPAGAGIVGAAAASGYYITSVWTHSPATRLVAINMVAIGVSTYALIQYQNYTSMTLSDGRSVSDLVDFWTYYRVAIESTSLQFRLRHVAMGQPTGALGTLGYVYEALRVVGFLLGGFVVYVYLRDKAFCKECKRYFIGREVLLTATDAGEVDEFAKKLWFGVQDLADRFAAVIREQAQKFDVRLSHCPGCDVKQLEFAAYNRKGERSPFARYLFRGESPFLPGTAAEAVAQGGRILPAKAEHIPPPPRVACWKCKADLDVTPDAAGKRARCPQCGTRQELPR